jgi:cytochrome c553
MTQHKQGVREGRASGFLQRFIFNGLFSTSLFLVSANAQPAMDVGSHAYAFRTPFDNLNHITPLHALRLQDMDTTAHVQEAVQAALTATNLMPDGQHALLNLDLDFLAIAKAQATAVDADGKPVQIMTADGSLLPDQGIWLDQGIAAVQQRVRDFFTLYRQAGGKVDMVALEYSGLSLTADELHKAAEASGSVADYLAAIEADPRFAEIQMQLGFTDLASLYAGDAQATKRQQRWNALMKQRVAAYLKQAFHQPLAAIFPQAQVTARDYYRQAADFKVPNSDFANTTGANAGNAQGQSLSGTLPATGLTVAGKTYPPNAFNAFRYETNRLRGAALSSQTPVFPTLTAKSQAEADADSKALLTNSDLYQEMVLHAGLAGARQFIYQNQHATAAEETQLDNTLAELDHYVGKAKFAAQIDNLVDWQQPFVLSSAIGDKGKVWRFTPRLDADTTLASTIRQVQPATFQVDGTQITLPNTKVVTDATASISQQGVWATAVDASEATVAGCATTLAVGQECTAYYAGDQVAPQANLLLEKAAPTLTYQAEPTVLFAHDWKSGGADAGVGRDHFTVQYNANLTFPAGTQQLAVTADDAVKVWVDGALVLDGATTEPTPARTLQRNLNLSGKHQVRMEYTDLAGAAAVSLRVQVAQTQANVVAATDCSSVPAGQFCGEYFANATLSDAPVAVATTPTIDFNWGVNKPLDTVPADNFSVRWVGDFDFEAGAYTFSTVTDDGVRLWVDDELVIDMWKVQSATTYRKSTPIKAGKHRIKMEYYDSTSTAVAKLSWAKNASTCDVIPTGQYCAEYFNNVDVAGDPVKVQNEAAINYAWKDMSPAPEVNADNFSVRWQGDFDLAGDYRFIAQGDDRIRVWVDGKIIIDAWTSSNLGEYFSDQTLAAGQHRIRVEMREYGGYATAKLFWEQRSDCSGVPDNAFCGSFFDGETLSGDVKRSQKVSAINFDWGVDRPMHGVKTDAFSARWLGNFDFPQDGYYRFNGKMDDGVRVWVDDALVVDQWTSDGRWPYKFQVVPYIKAGKHQVKVEYHESYGTAAIQVNWALVDGCGTTPENAFCMAYFDNKTLDGLPRQVVQTAPTIDYAWGTTAPTDAFVGADNYSVRWVGKIAFDEGLYRFVTDVDDSVRIWVDGELFLDAWTRTSPNNGKYRKLKPMTAGLHDIKVEYFESSSTANAKVFWEKAPDCANVPLGKFCASFFDGNDLTKPAVDSRLDDAINFDWGVGSALPNYLVDNFAVSWVGDFNFESGQYTFTSTTDDGVRVWLDNELVINSWKDQAATLKKSLQVAEGKHRVRMEYYEKSYTAVAKLTWAKNSGCATIPTGSYCAEYYNNNNLTDDPVKIQNEAAINYEWLDTAPVDTVSKDNFSVRWQGDFELVGNYRFLAQVDEAMRLWVDGKLLLDTWNAYNYNELYADVSLAAGKHRIKMEMREIGGNSRAKLSWEEKRDCSGIPDNVFCGSFFKGEALEGDALRTQQYPNLNFDWATNRPLHSVPNDLFSARWVGNFDFDQAGYYRFNGEMDDGVRMWVDDILVIDQWKSDGRWPYKFQVTPYITAGKHVIKVEYHDSYGTAKLKLNWALVDGCGVTPDNAFCMSFFDNKTLDGFARQVVKTAPTINYDWGTTAPTDFIGGDHFSVRWIGNIAFEEGTYRFISELNDGAKVWVDGELLIDGWAWAGPYYGKYHKLKAMTAGLHQVKVEYFEYGSAATAKVFWEKAPDCSNVPTGKFCASFFDGIDLTKPAVDSRIDDAINFDWVLTGALTNYLVDNFAIRWVGDFDFAEDGQYTFTSMTDDGVRVWLDDELLIDNWRTQAVTTNKKAVQVKAGKHRVRMEYFENGSTASAKLTWAKNAGCSASTIPTGSYCAEYYNNNAFTDDPFKIQNDAAVNFNWGAAAPLDGMVADNFSVRWQGDFELEGDYRFVAQVDDGIRVWLDGQLIIDQWSASAYIEYFKDLSLVAGKHRIKVEMREAGGSAAAKLFWEERHECSGIPDNQFCGEFFDGTTLTGSVIRSQLTPSINFDWGANRPMHAVKSDSFSARWQGKFNFNAGFYRFVGDADDGMRVWIDDVLVIDHWSMDGTWLGKVQSVPYVAAGSHVVKVEYREGSGTAKAKLGWEEVAGCATTPDNLFCMELYNSADLTGFARQVMKTDSINFDWAANAPDPMVSKDYFSVRWTGNIHFDQGQYRFLTDVDDGVKIWIDGELFIDAWTAPAPWYGKQRKLKTLTAGLHQIKVEYRETGGSAKAKVWWEATPDCTTEIPQGKFCGSFFNTRDLTGNVADNRYDDAINFDWGTVAPQSNVFADNFSARWQGKFDFAEGEYTFTARSDDGVRLWIDGVSAIDAWKTQSPTTYTKRLFLTGGLHTIKMEYYDYTSTAVAQLSWKAEQLNEPQIPANLRTATLAQDKVVLAWDTQPIVTQYKIYKDADLLTTTAGTTTTDTAVTAVTSYTYKVTALWPNGKESRPAVLSVTIPDTQVPTAPTKLAVQALTPTSVTLAWTAATDNVAVKSYQIWRNNVMVAETSVAGFVDSGLKNTTKYSYKVMAVDTSGNVSPASTTLSVTTKDSSAPTVPTGLAAEVLSAAQISLTWQPATDNVGVTGYRVLRDGVQVGTSTQPAFIDTTIKQDTLYRYQVLAVDAVGNASTPSAVVEVISGDATAPSAPPNLTAKVTADQQVHLEWNAATDNKAVVKYRVIRDGRTLSMTDLLAYNDVKVQKGQSYTYSVKALDAAGNASLDSNTITISVDGICESTQLYYKQNVESVMANCTSCHVAGGMATNSRLILSTAADATNRNLGAINTITQILGKQTVLDKVSEKVAHGGGEVLSIDSAEYVVLGNLLSQLITTGQCTDVVNNDEPVLTESLAANCFSCHGSQGASAGPGTPGISGMSKSYLNKVLTDYQTGARASTVMARMVKGFSADELSRLADYFSQQPYVASTQATDSNLVTRGQVLHEQYCASCHTANGRDANLTGARLAGQWKPYLHATLKDYVKGRSQATTGMSDQVRALYNAEGDNGVAALAEFYASNSQDTQAPEKPSDLDAVSYTPTSTTLTWTDSNDDWGVLYYDIYRDGVWVGRTRFNSYTDSGLKAGHYTYTVVAVDIFGNQSVVSDSVSSVITSDEAAPDGVQLLNFPDTLRKASVVLLNRLPTQAELDAAKTEDGFRTTLRQMMDTKGAMDAFVYRAGHETFLSVGAAGIGSSTGLVGADFPNLLNMTQTEVNAANDAVRKEPVYLLQYMVGNDKPWTDALTANYTVMNPQLTKATAALTLNGAFTDPTNAKELRPVRIPFVSARYPSKAFAHAGVLSTNAWLSRFPTTDTNRNRHRAAKVYKQFLGVDIETLAQRPLDDSKNGNYRVPTMQNPNCMVCHTLMEPVAGAFRDWGANSWYLQNYNGTTGTKDSLSSVYKSGSYPLDNNGQPWYHTGDTWYRDMFPTGFNNRTAPGGYSSFGGKTWTTTDNLLASPSAETGVTGWVVNKGKLEATNKTTCSKVPLAPRTGTYLYQLGSCATTSDETLAWQDIDITSSATLIDQAKAEIDFGAYFNALNGQDTPSVWVEFLDKSGVSVGKSSILTDKTSWTWVNKTATQVVPKNTRKLRFTVQGLRSTQTWADKFVDAYVDDLFLVLRTPDKNMLTITGTQDNLQWLGKQLIQDPRFAKGGVYFWFKPLFKRDPLKSPVDTSAANYATQMAAYNAQDELLEQMAKRFAYDQGHGAWNVKDLLIDMTASPLFRAKAGELSTEQEQTLSDSGLSRLLTPEELNAKVKSLTNYDWSAFRQDNAWWYSMGLFYGGFDGGRYQNKPNTDMNSLMSNIPERMAIELSCNAVADDFRLAAGSRKLFPFVEATDTPVYEEVDTTALNLLVNPGAETGMEGWSMEQGTARILAGAVGCDGGPSIKSGKAIFNPGSICVNPTPLGLMYQKVDLTAWDQEIDAGTSKVLFGAALRGWSTSNDEASVYLSFRDVSDNELAKSPVLSGKEGYWKTEMAYAMIPAGTRSVRFYLQGKRIDTSTNPNNDSFIDDTYLRVVTPSDNYMPAGERRVRSNLQYLYRQFLNEKLAIDDPEITRSFNLFSEVWTNRNDTTDVACRLYSSWEDPNYTKRAWGVVMMYLMNDARFLYE